MTTPITHPGRDLVAVFLIGLAATCSISAQDLTPSEARAIATEAYVYGFPLVESYRTMYAYAIKAGGDQYKAAFNTLKNEANVFTAADTAVVTPNADTPSSFLWMDLRSEPLVVGVPEIVGNRYYSIQFIDLYTFNFAYVGTRTTGNGGGSYLIAGPGWQGEMPDGVNKLIRCETEFALAIFRTQLFGPDDLENVQRIQKSYTAQPLSTFLGKPAPDPPAAIDFPQPHTSTTAELGYFSDLNFVLQYCPTHPTETELMARLAKIGVGRGRSFNGSTFSPEIQRALKLGMADGQAAIAKMVSKATSAEIYGSRAYLKDNFLKRAVAAKVGLYGNSKEEALYPLYLTDAGGKPLDGSGQNYVINFAADQLPPARAFWSVTMYDGKTQTLVPNAINRYLLNSQMLENMKRNADGGLTIFVQRDTPNRDGNGQANWLPAPNGPFYLVMRLYWPRPEALDLTWTPPLVWPASAHQQQETVPVPKGAGIAQEVKPSVLADEPKPEMERPTVWGEPTEVKIGIYIVDVDEVNTAQQSFAASVYVMASWKNPLLRHKGPGPMHRGVTEVWTPRLTIIGQQQVWRSYPEFVEIHPDGEVVYRQKMWGHFSQPMDLHNFPMDQQILTIHMVAAGMYERHVKMVPFVLEDVEISGVAERLSVPDFVVRDWQAEPQSYLPRKGRSGTAGYQIQITVKRSPIYYVLKVIVPLCLIVIMSWLPRWIDPEQSGTNIGISTTSFLTLVAYLFAITVLLPRVSYVTRIDRFILLSTLLVFLSLLQTVAHTSLLRGKKNDLVERSNAWSRIVYPVTLALILGLSFWI